MSNDPDLAYLISAPRYVCLKWQPPAENPRGSRDSGHSYAIGVDVQQQRDPSKLSPEDLDYLSNFVLAAAKPWRRRGVLEIRDKHILAIVQKTAERFSTLADACKWLEGAKNIEGRHRNRRGGAWSDTDREVEGLVKSLVDIEEWLDDHSPGAARRSKNWASNAQIRNKFATAEQMENIVKGSRTPQKTRS